MPIRRRPLSVDGTPNDVWGSSELDPQVSTQPNLDQPPGMQIDLTPNVTAPPNPYVPPPPVSTTQDEQRSPRVYTDPVPPPVTAPPPVAPPVTYQPPTGGIGAGNNTGPLVDTTKTTQPNPVGYSVGNYTYAGFEPSSYTRNVGVTNPAAAGKDWVYRYLRDNNIAPNATWAPGAAAALNKQYNTNVFNAIDGETLGYGDEYVHSAPNGYGLRGGQYDPNAGGEFFWGATGGGPATGGSGSNGGSGAGAGSGSGSGGGQTYGNDNRGIDLQALGQLFGGPGNAGVFDTSAVQQVGQDPLSQLLTGALAGLIGNAAGTLNQQQDPQSRVRAMESARMDYEIPRKVQRNNLQADLANRNLLSVPGIPQGSEVGALTRMEEALAPVYTGAISDRLLNLDQLDETRTNNARNAILNAVNSGTNRQQVLSTIAVQTLEQNRLWNEFLAKYGLDRAKAIADISSGQNNQLLLLFQQFLTAANTAGAGYI